MGLTGNSVKHGVRYFIYKSKRGIQKSSNKVSRLPWDAESREMRRWLLNNSDFRFMADHDVHAIKLYCNIMICKVVLFVCEW